MRTQRFLDTLGEACAKADWQVHAWCQMRNHFHLIVETPTAAHRDDDDTEVDCGGIADGSLDTCVESAGTGEIMGKR